MIDRFEGEWAVIECGRKVFNLPRFLLPLKAAEGDVIRILVTVDEAATAGAKGGAADLAEELFEKGEK